VTVLGLRVAVVWSGVALSATILPGASPNPRIERGRYLVEQVSMCGDCHTPMTPKGEPDRTKWMMGSALFFQAKMPVPDWAEEAPSLAGLAGYTDAQVIGILRTGLKDGKPLRPPMPQFRFSPADAEAIVAYLRNLKPPLKPQGKR
jgi:mono/diheme cytochrome c family protein